MSGFANRPYGTPPYLPQTPKKLRLFVSYYHDEDQAWYGAFVIAFGATYDLFTDTSLERQVDSADSDYVRRSIRENNIAGSSLTIVLCGRNTWKRRWVDWEIQMTLNKEHGLLGIVLPSHQAAANGNYFVPNRLFENINNGYAAWMFWPQNAGDLATVINMAKERAKNTWLIVNPREAMKRSLA